MSRIKFKEEFPEQFRGLYCGTSLGAGWDPIVHKALLRVREALTPAEMEHFSWTQIKEKWGRLEMYNDVSPVRVSLTSATSRIDINVDRDDDESADDKALRERIWRTVDAIVQDAEREAARTCERCGAPGRHYAQRAYTVACDMHAMEDGWRTFPIAYGVWIPNPGMCSVGKRSSVREMYFRDRVIISWRALPESEGVQGEEEAWCEREYSNDYVFEEDLPDWLAAELKAAQVPVLMFMGRPAVLASEILPTLLDVEGRHKEHLALPAGCRVSHGQAVILEALKDADEDRFRFERVDLGPTPRLATLLFEKGGRQLYTVNEWGEAERVAWPWAHIGRQLKQLEEQADELRELLETFPEEPPWV